GRPRMPSTLTKASETSTGCSTDRHIAAIRLVSFTGRPDHGKIEPLGAAGYCRRTPRRHADRDTPPAVERLPAGRDRETDRPLPEICRTPLPRSAMPRPTAGPGRSKPRSALVPPDSLLTALLVFCANIV